MSARESRNEERKLVFCLHKWKGGKQVKGVAVPREKEAGASEKLKNVHGFFSPEGKAGESINAS